MLDQCVATLVQPSRIRGSGAPNSEARIRLPTAMPVCRVCSRRQLMRVNVIIGLAIVGLVVAAAPLRAHHSFAAEYDSNKPVTITGAVTKLEWMNPHARFYVDVTENDGKVTHWNFELGAIPVLVKQGWRRDSLKVGDVVTVDGARAKDGSTTANARAVKLADGRRVFAGSSGGDQAPAP